MVAPVIGAAALAGGAGIIGTAMGHFMGRSSARSQMDFQREMSNTSHQREVADLRAAGLNPILSAKLGGSSTPLGAQAQQPDYSSPVRDAASAAAAASGIKLQQAQVRNLDADSSNKEVTARIANRTELVQVQSQIEALEKLKADTGVSSATKSRIDQEIRNLLATEALIKSQHAHSAADFARARQEERFWKSKLGDNAVVRKHLGNLPAVLSSAKDAYEQFGPAAKSWMQKNIPVRPRKYSPGASGRW